MDILTLIDMCTRFPEAVPLKNIDTCTVAEELLKFSGEWGYETEYILTVDHNSHQR